MLHTWTLKPKQNAPTNTRSLTLVELLTGQSTYRHTSRPPCPKTDADCYKNQYQNPSKNGVTWRSLKCDNEWVKNAMRNQKDRWYELGADAAWKNATDSWKASPHEGGFNFSQTISFFFNGDEGMSCETTADSNKCTQAYHCSDFEGTGAAAYFVINSMTSIESVSTCKEERRRANRRVNSLPVLTLVPLGALELLRRYLPYGGNSQYRNFGVHRRLCPDGVGARLAQDYHRFGIDEVCSRSCTYVELL